MPLSISAEIDIFSTKSLLDNKLLKKSNSLLFKNMNLGKI